MKKKSLKPWIIMLVLPWILLFGGLVMSVAVRTVAESNSSCQASVDDLPNDCPPTALETGSNIILLLCGVAAILGILGTPLWIIMLVRATSYNRKLLAPNGVAETQSPPQEDNAAPPESPQTPSPTG